MTASPVDRRLFEVRELIEAAPIPRPCKDLLAWGLLGGRTDGPRGRDGVGCLDYLTLSTFPEDSRQAHAYRTRRTVAAIASRWGRCERHTRRVIADCEALNILDVGRIVWGPSDYRIRVDVLEKLVARLQEYRQIATKRAHELQARFLGSPVKLRPTMTAAASSALEVWLGGEQLRDALGLTQARFERLHSRLDDVEIETWSDDWRLIRRVLEDGCRVPVVLRQLGEVGRLHKRGIPRELRRAHHYRKLLAAAHDHDEGRCTCSPAKRWPVYVAPEHRVAVSALGERPLCTWRSRDAWPTFLELVRRTAGHDADLILDARPRPVGLHEGRLVLLVEGLAYPRFLERWGDLFAEALDVPVAFAASDLPELWGSSELFRSSDEIPRAGDPG